MMKKILNLCNKTLFKELGTRFAKTFIPVVLFYGDVYFLKFCGVCRVAFKWIITFKMIFSVKMFVWGLQDDFYAH